VGRVGEGRCWPVMQSTTIIFGKSQYHRFKILLSIGRVEYEDFTKKVARRGVSTLPVVSVSRWDAVHCCSVWSAA
jgi:hypothetical protein